VPKRTGKLSSRLAALASPALRGASPAEQAKAVALPARGAGSLVHVGGRLVVNVRVSSTSEATLAGLRDAGARVLTVSPRYLVVSVAVEERDLGRLAAVAGVRSAAPQFAPLTNAACPQGSVVSEADTQLHAAAARATFGVSGAGQKVGVISDSFDQDLTAPKHAAQDVASGDLPGTGNPCNQPTPVDVLVDGSGADEGRAMAQVVHDLAPSASLAFAAAGNSQFDMIDSVNALRQAGASVIADDITFLDEPFFQDGPLAVAVNDADAGGVAYFSSAGNDNLPGGGGSWEAPSYRPATPTPCPAVLTAPSIGLRDCMNFGSAVSPQVAQAFTMAPHSRFFLDLQWAEPWFGVGTDLDAFLLDQSGTLILAGSNDDNLGSQEPVEIFSYSNVTASPQTVKLVIGRFAGSGTPRLKWVLLQGGGITRVTSTQPGEVVGPTIFGHNGTSGAISTAAVPYDDSTVVEDYSSRGPETHYFGPVTSDTPASALGSPDVVEKPDLSATDGGATTFFGDPDGNVFRFYGTSEAAPHAAAVAALAMEADPGVTAAQVESAMLGSATNIGGFTARDEGHGLVDAGATIAALRSAVPLPTVSTGAPANVTASSATTNGTVNPRGVLTVTRFEYGTTTAYGSTTPTTAAGSGTSDVPVSAALSALSPGTTYHYRVVAVRNGVVAAKGNDQAFTTAGAPPGGGGGGGTPPGGGGGSTGGGTTGGGGTTTGGGGTTTGGGGTTTGGGGTTSTALVTFSPSTLKLGRGGTITVTLSFTPNARAGTAKLVVLLRGRRVGSATVRVRPAARIKVKVRLSRAALSALRKSRRLKLTLRLTPPGATKPVSRTVALRR
jgi:hypothetical protein